MKLIDPLQADESQMDMFSLLDQVLRHLQDLGHGGLFCVLHVREPNRRVVYTDLDLLWPFCGLFCVNDNRSDLHYLVELFIISRKDNWIADK